MKMTRGDSQVGCDGDVLRTMELGKRGTTFGSDGRGKGRGVVCGEELELGLIRTSD